MGAWMHADPFISSAPGHGQGPHLLCSLLHPSPVSTQVKFMKVHAPTQGPWCSRDCFTVTHTVYVLTVMNCM